MTTISPSEYERRIRQLETLNATLAAQVDRQAKVVEAAHLVANGEFGHGYSTVDALTETVKAYDTAMAQLAKGG